MTVIRHSLQPFKASPKGVVCSCSIQKKAGFLLLDFTLTGELGKLVIPDKVKQPVRKDELWQTTCFECFFKNMGSKNYWELNYSPGGDWNLYHFIDYREGMSLEKRVTTVKSERSQTAHEFTFLSSIPLHDLACQGESIQVGLSCVLESKNGTKGYHALCHPGEQPDFHHQDSFLITLPPCS